jgi:hypothetical protein
MATPAAVVDAAAELVNDWHEQVEAAGRREEH